MVSKVEEKRAPRPPKWLFKNIVNPTMRFILRSPLHGLLSGGVSLITFTGRKSGKQFTTPVAYHVESEKVVYVFTRDNWWKNFEDGGRIQIRIRGKNRTGTPEIILDQNDVWQILSRYIQKYDGNHRRVGIMTSMEAKETEVRAIASDMLAIKITLD